MQFHAAYYWQSADNNSALVLQQAYHKKKRIPLLLAGICEATEDKQTAGQFMTELADWFHECALPLCRKKGKKGVWAAGRSLEHFLRNRVRNEEGLQMSGIFCVENSFYLFGMDGMQIRILNQKGNSPNIRRLRMGEEKVNLPIFQEGVMQAGVGILLATKGFCEQVTEKCMLECLNTKELCTGSNVEKRLHELGDAAEVKGGKNMAAIFLIK